MFEHFVHELPNCDSAEDLQDILNDISLEGWELCGTTIGNFAVFKRPLRIASDHLEKVRERRRLTEIMTKRASQKAAPGDPPPKEE